ncbi:MAG: hypothetical protein ICV74_01570 [Thermoleophilia bacterium]|nr:hypothetical protein [Thermoleophilia bacterium]
MSTLLALLPIAQERAPSVAEEGRHIIIVMLVTGLVFLSVIALGQLARYFGHRRKARRRAHRVY